MRISDIAAALLAATLLGPVAAAPASAAPAHDQTAGPRAGTVHPRSDVWEAKVLRLVNARRSAHGLKPLAASPCADSFAEPWARHMASTRTMEHQSLTPFFGCRNTHTVGENIAYGFDTPRQLMSAWMHSPGHRANILNPHFNRIGIAGWVSVDGVTYAVQDFLG